MSTTKITFLGTGAPDATKYYNTCYFVEEKKSNILVDTGGGNGILTNLQKANIPLEKIKNIFITHAHIDHILGILWILRFLGSKISKGESDSLNIYCSEKVKNIIQDISNKFLKAKVLKLFGNKIQFTVISNDQIIHINQWEFEIFSVLSLKEEQFGFKLKLESGQTLTTLGDEPYKEGLDKYCAGVDFLIHDAFCLEEHQNIFTPHEIHHSTVIDAAKNASRLKTNNLILIHTEDEKTFGSRKRLYSEEAKNHFKGKVIVPDDLEILEIN